MTVALAQAFIIGNLPISTSSLYAGRGWGESRLFGQVGAVRVFALLCSVAEIQGTDSAVCIYGAFAGNGAYKRQ